MNKIHQTNYQAEFAGKAIMEANVVYQFKLEQQKNIKNHSMQSDKSMQKQLK